MRKNRLFTEWQYGDVDLTIQEQIELVNDYLDFQYALLQESFPDLHLTMTGSITNEFGIAMDEKARRPLLTKKELDEQLNKCKGCGQEYDEQTKVWIYQRFGIDFPKEAKDIV